MIIKYYPRLTLILATTLLALVLLGLFQSLGGSGTHHSPPPTGPVPTVVQHSDPQGPVIMV